MSSQKLSSIKIFAFDKEHYFCEIRKYCCSLKLLIHHEILNNGPFVPQKKIPAATSGRTIIPAHYVVKEQYQRIKIKRDKVGLDSYLQLIIIESHVWQHF